MHKKRRCNTPQHGAGTTDDAQASSRDVSADVENEPCVSEAGSISAAVVGMDQYLFSYHF